MRIGNLTDRSELWRQEAGFTLPEIIAALAILSLALSSLFALLSDGLNRTSQAKRMAEAESLAQSLLARVGSELAIQPGTTTGDFPNGYRWRLKVTRYGDAAEQRAWPVAAYTLSAAVASGQGAQERTVVLTTLRLAPKDATP
jgi:general secretion pathway protein I